MKKHNIFIRNSEQKITFHPQCIVFFSENKVNMGKLENGNIFFVVPNKDVFTNFKKQFNIPSSIIIVEKKYANSELFAYRDNLCETNEKLLGGITAIENACLGDGIYCVPEQDYVKNNKPFTLLKEYNFERTGINTDKDVVLIFEYTGYYYKILNSENLNGICKLLAFHVSLDDIKAMIESTIEYIYD